MVRTEKWHWGWLWCPLGVTCKKIKIKPVAVNKVLVPMRLREGDGSRNKPKMLKFFLLVCWYVDREGTG